MKQRRLIQRQHPLFSTTAVAATLILLVLLGVALWLTGGRAFSPGDLSAVATNPQNSGGFAVHADFENDCTRCHEPLVGLTAERCQACHTTIEQQRAQQTGLHGRLNTSDCALCHTEHQGRSFDQFTAVIDAFNEDHHAQLFPLSGAHRDLACTDCHQEAQYATLSPDCAGCHEVPDWHQNVTGTDCSRCHTAVAWQPAQLSRHRFPLDHESDIDIACATCHTNSMDVYTCAACHDPQEMQREHQAEDIEPETLPFCIDCHPTGEEE